MERIEMVPIELLIKGKSEKLTDDEIQKLIDENYHHYDESVFGGGPGAVASQAK